MQLHTFCARTVQIWVFVCDHLHFLLIYTVTQYYIYLMGANESGYSVLIDYSSGHLIPVLRRGYCVRGVEAPALEAEVACF